MPRQVDGRARRALVIGIDAYTEKPLDGCVADAQLIAQLLQDRFAFEARDIRTLHNAQARRRAILAELDALVELTGPDDVAFVFYAGHGSMMVDEDGDEATGFDNTLNCSDDPREDILDDELAERLALLGARTPHTVLVIDACNSGTITRDAFGGTGRFTPPVRRSAADRGGTRARRPRARAAVGAPTSTDRYVLIAACRDGEIANEAAIPGDEQVHHGALTYALCQELEKARSKETWRDVFERVAARVTAANRAQHPQLAGAADRVIFGLDELPPMRFVPVTERASDTVRLGVGAVHGATAGSVFAVYPQGTKDAGDAKPLGTVKILRVNATTSRAEIVQERAAGAVAEGSRAVQTEHVYDRKPLAVQLVAAGVDDGALATLRARVEREPMLTVVKSPKAALARVYRLAPRQGGGAKDPLPMLGALAEPTWAIAGRDGRLIAPVTDTTSEEEVIAALVRRAEFESALAIDNVDPASRMRGNVTLEIVRKAASGEWLAIAADDTTGLPVVDSGEVVDFRITNHLDEPVYVTLLDFEPSGAVTELTRGGSHHLAAGASWNASHAGKGKGFRMAWDGEDAVECFKLFATVQPVDVSYLLRGPAAERAAEAIDPLSQDDWTSVVRSIVIRRRNAPGGA